MKSRLRAWSHRVFYDPEPVLRELRRLEDVLSAHELPELVRRLRTNKLKTDREARDALIFAHGMAAVLKTKVLVAPGEVEDCDFITRFTIDEVDHLSCVQLKELAPADLNANQTIDSLLDKLRGLPPSDAVLAIHLNRRLSIPFGDLAAEEIPYTEVWYFWAADPSTTKWRICGDAKATPRVVEFEYPR